MTNYPTVQELSKDTDHPELTTLEYRDKAHSECHPRQEFLPVFAHIDTKDGKFVIATNQFNGFVFESTIICTSDFEVIHNADAEKAKLILYAPSPVTVLKLLSANLVSILN